MVPKTLLLLIGVLFISWGFNKFVGIIGLIVVLTYYWREYLKSRRVTRMKIKGHKENIISRFENFNGKTGAEHFDYLYSYAQNLLHFKSFLTLTYTNFTVQAGVIIMSFFFITTSDWISLTACIIIGLSTTLFSLKYLRYFRYIIGVAKLGRDASDEMMSDLDGYVEFFAEEMLFCCHLDKD